jgi:predicted nucleic acid-binding protein
MSQLLRLYIDADVLFRAATRSHQQTAAYIVLKLADLTLLEVITARHAFHEALRNLHGRTAAGAAELLDLAGHSLQIISDPTASMLVSVQDQANPKDVINLAAAQEGGAPLLITFNTSDYFVRTAPVRVMTPGQFIETMRVFMAEAWRNL